MARLYGAREPWSRIRTTEVAAEEGRPFPEEGMTRQAEALPSRTSDYSEIIVRIKPSAGIGV
jgi:hypothetical protein